MGKAISEGGHGATIPFKPPKKTTNLKFYKAQFISGCYRLFICIVNSSLVRVCFPMSKIFFFMTTVMQ